MDFTTFFDIYMRPKSRRLLDRDGIEFRYAAASLLIACSKSDMDEDPNERKVIRQILIETFNLSEYTLNRLLEFADTASEAEYRGEIINLINDQFTDRDKRFLLEKLWVVAYADGHIESQERAFIDQIADGITMTAEDVETAHVLAQHQLQEV
ncbi:MAG: TerB family tellurite resistance protein [Pseudomonadales bacterium]|nr:TerB family tellurite resistance protein [Pseudomonadales bacterium]MBO6656144.1 TerB family tellurite resistance protein [Pseudomonadales bacterium]MBO6703683.1 TerB family tellurite resistance protein [Pseudomonadales bacterium]MBO7004260.1 TerB family tellurite resistance protein [Pseudomonadales bacterium]